MTDNLVKMLPTRGFARGSVVRKFGQGPNMLVIRQMEKTTVLVVIEGDEDGTLRLREMVSDDLEEVLGDHGRQDKEFDLRWKADMRAIKKWREEHPNNELTWPDHVDLVIWLAERDKKQQARITELEAQLKAGQKNERDAIAKWMREIGENLMPNQRDVLAANADIIEQNTFKRDTP